MAGQLLLGTPASPEVDQGTHGLNPEVDQDSRVLHLIYFWGDLLLADLLLGMLVYTDMHAHIPNPKTLLA